MTLFFLLTKFKSLKTSWNLPFLLNLLILTNKFILFIIHNRVYLIQSVLKYSSPLVWNLFTKSRYICHLPKNIVLSIIVTPLYLRCFPYTKKAITYLPNRVLSFLTEIIDSTTLWLCMFFVFMHAGKYQYQNSRNIRNHIINLGWKSRNTDVHTHYS